MNHDVATILGSFHLMSQQFTKMTSVKVTFSPCIPLELESLFIILEKNNILNSCIIGFLEAESSLTITTAITVSEPKVFQSNILLLDYP